MTQELKPLEKLYPGAWYDEGDKTKAIRDIEEKLNEAIERITILEANQK